MIHATESHQVVRSSGQNIQTTLFARSRILRVESPESRVFNYLFVKRI